MDHVFHLAMLAIGVAAFFIVPATAAIPIFVVLTGVAVATFVTVRRAVRLPARTGIESLAGDAATVVEWQGDGGLVRHRGEIWRAEAPSALAPRARVRIVAADGTLLRVRQDDAGPGRPRRPT